VMVSPLNNVFTFRNAHTCLQCAAYQARAEARRGKLPRQMTQTFRTHKPTAKESGECVLRGIPGINLFSEHRGVPVSFVSDRPPVRISAKIPTNVPEADVTILGYFIQI
jgi:hypothetical protein